MESDTVPSVGIKALFRPALFWDAEAIDRERHAAYVIARVLDLGDARDVLVLRTVYTDAQLIQAIRTRRSLRPRTARYWALYFGIPAGEIACLKPSCL